VVSYLFFLGPNYLHLKMVLGSAKAAPVLELMTEEEDEGTGNIPSSITCTQAHTGHASMGRALLRQSACHVWTYQTN
jgi:hypothetical protein